MSCPIISEELVKTNDVILESLQAENIIVGGGGVCLDATALLNNTLGTEISSTTIASGASADITAPDATAVIKDTQGNILQTVNIPSGVTQDIIVETVIDVNLIYAGGIYEDGIYE